LIHFIIHGILLKDSNFPPIPSRQDFAIQPYPTLEDWLDLALPKLGERRLLLNLDELVIDYSTNFAA
jgi:hypothetical protein